MDREIGLRTDRRRLPGSGRGFRALQLVLGFASLTLCGGPQALAGAPTAQSDLPLQRDCRQVESDRFVFHSDPWINLHHFLFQWARNVPDRSPGDRRRAVDVTEAAQLEDLTQEEQRSWMRAVNFYRDRLVDGDLLFDRDLIALRERLAAIGCTEGARDIGDAELQSVLEKAMPIYRRHWWVGHDAGNSAWITELLDRLKSYGTSLARRLAEAYGGDWPSKRIRVDVVAYASWAGAYTTNHPDHVTVSSTSYAGLGGLEILFHEVSHASFFEQRIFGQVAEAFSPYGIDPPDRLVHVIQFVTPAELLRSMLDGEDLDGFQSVAERVYEKGSYREKYGIVLRYWKPFLDGRIGRAEALDQIAAAIAT